MLTEMEVRLALSLLLVGDETQEYRRGVHESAAALLGPDVPLAIDHAATPCEQDSEQGSEAA